MRRTLIVSDIHGCIKPFNRLLEQEGYNAAKDKLILLGDYVDRGPHSKEVVDRVMELVQDHGAIALRGNHDHRFVQLIRTNLPDTKARFLKYGGVATLSSYMKASKPPKPLTTSNAKIQYIRKHYARHIQFLEKLPLYYEDEHHIFVHAGINPKYARWQDQPEHDFMYIRDEFHHAKLELAKMVVFGHTKTSKLHASSDIWFSDGKIGIDGGCAYGKQLNMLIFEEGTYRTAFVKG
ncbi:metallophosphoesterase family protein [Paenibacillus sp. 1001270B_150601_E10]|uniref:metallophosphoesterase family protein n=1 Tax=Paenibacillus sp. 1001270B_150601_E10 TaxID=2787079 RepID=UPI00189DFF2C|nr:metallophosphoesterase family protein [Paenibacillus sp. 1001270B_150601_E10]